MKVKFNFERRIVHKRNWVLMNHHYFSSIRIENTAVNKTDQNVLVFETCITVKSLLSTSRYDIDFQPEMYSKNMWKAGIGKLKYTSNT